MESTTSQTAMTSKLRQSLLCSLVCMLLLSGCSTMPPESPICVPLRPVAEDILVLEQAAIREVSPDLLRRVALNDATWKGHVLLLEDMIRNHDEPLGDCD